MSLALSRVIIWDFLLLIVQTKTKPEEHTQNRFVLPRQQDRRCQDLVGRVLRRDDNKAIDKVVN